MSTLDLTEDRQRSLARLLSSWLEHRRAEQPGPVAEPWIEVREAEVLRAGRPGLLDVVAEVDGRRAHAVLGLRRPGQEARLLHPSDESALGLLEDDHGMGVVVDALRDAELATLVLGAILSSDAPSGAVAAPAFGPASVLPQADDDQAVVLDFDDWCSLSVFPWLGEGTHPGVELLVALDEAGFNHLAAPIARWRRGGSDLGLVQELLSSRTDGWALALTSLRDLFAAGGAPEAAGGDFGSEAFALGTMTARMHLALDRAYGRRSVPVEDWGDTIEATVRAADAGLLARPDVADTLAQLREAGQRGAAVRTHGDLTLTRIARTDQGWVIADFLPHQGAPEGPPWPSGFGSPLGDVADLLWSLHRVATVAAAERDQTGRAALGNLARAWEARNRRALMAGYLATPGVGGLVPADRRLVRALTTAFEIERAAGRRHGRRSP